MSLCLQTLVTSSSLVSSSNKTKKKFSQEYSPSTTKFWTRTDCTVKATLLICEFEESEKKEKWKQKKYGKTLKIKFCFFKTIETWKKNSEMMQI